MVDGYPLCLFNSGKNISQVILCPWFIEVDEKMAAEQALSLNEGSRTAWLRPIDIQLVISEQPPVNISCFDTWNKLQSVITILIQKYEFKCYYCSHYYGSLGVTL